MHAGSRRRDQRGLAAREEGGEQDADENRHQGEPIVGRHRSASFSTRKAWTSAASTSGAMKLAPIPRASKKVNLPGLTFLARAKSTLSQARRRSKHLRSSRM